MLDPPDLASWAAPIFWWVQNDPVISPPPTSFTLDKSYCIIGDESDRCILKTCSVTVFESMGDCFLACINMCNFGAGFSSMQTGNA